MLIFSRLNYILEIGKVLIIITVITFIAKSLFFNNTISPPTYFLFQKRGVLPGA